MTWLISFYLYEEEIFSFQDLVISFTSEDLFQEMLPRLRIGCQIWEEGTIKLTIL